MNRRTFIRSTIVNVISIGLVSNSQEIMAVATTPSIKLTHENLKLDLIFPDINSAKVIGQKFIEQEVKNINKYKLLENCGLNKFSSNKSVSQLELKTAFINQRTLDFTNGNTIILDGFILARSEVSLCALLAVTEIE